MSPRITSIVVSHYSTGQTHSFATHAVAETLSISKDNIVARYDEVEGELLKRFYAFVRDKKDAKWVHWRMRSIVYGFEHLAHRYRVLTNEDPIDFPAEARIDLSDVLKARYGSDYAPDPRMKNLMMLNGKVVRGFLTGEEEAKAFKAGEFVRLNGSTISKVDFFRHVITLALRGKLKTAGKSLTHLVDRVLESRSARMWAMTGTTIGVLLGIYNLIHLLQSFF
jgi:hypothetical protein